MDNVWHRYLRRPYRLHVYDHGGSGPVIIFLHGLASSSANWDNLIPLLKDNYRCISIDLLGFGDSAKPQWCGYTINDHVKNVHHTIKALKLKEPFTLVGHSLGSLLATRYARLHPKAVWRLVLLSPPVYISPNHLTGRNARLRTSAYLRAYQFIRTHKRATPQNFVRLKRILPIPKSIVISDETWLPFIRSLELCIENQTFIDDIVHVKAPIDVFYGLFDQVIVPYNLKLLANLRGVTLHPLKVNHNVGKRYAAQVAQILTTR